MRRILKMLDQINPKVFQCSCGCVWESTQYQKHEAEGKIHRTDFCPNCGKIGKNIKSSSV